MSSAVAHALPPSVLALFAPRPPIEFKPPMPKRKMPPYTPIAHLVTEFEDPSQTPPPAPAPESKEARRERIAKLKADKAAEVVAAAAESYDPNTDEKIKGDPYKTLFVARLSYETTEAKLKKEFEQFGPIKRARLVFDTETGKPRGYAFVEYEQERDMKTAYKQGDGKKIDGRRVLVDVERGRTVRNWRPRRLAGGLGSTRGGNKSSGKAPSVPRDTESVAGGSFGGGGGGPPPPPAMGGGGMGGGGGSSYGGGGGGGSQAGGKLQWATERRGAEDRGKGYGGHERDRGRDDRASYRDDRDRGRDRSRDDRRGGSRERGREDRDRGRERGDRDR